MGRGAASAPFRWWTSSGEADFYQRAARTLRTVFERRRDDPLVGNAPQPLDCPLRQGHQLVVERDTDPFAAAHEVQGALVADVAVFAQQEPLHTELHPLGIVGAALDVRALAALVVDGRDLAVPRLDQVHAGNHAQALRGKGDRPRVQLLGVVHVRRRRQPAAVAVHASVGVAALDRVGRVDPLALHPLQVGEPRAVNVFVEHACRHQWRCGGGDGLDRRFAQFRGRHGGNLPFFSGKGSFRTIQRGAVGAPGMDRRIVRATRRGGIMLWRRRRPSCTLQVYI